MATAAALAGVAGPAVPTAAAAAAAAPAVAAAAGPAADGTADGAWPKAVAERTAAAGAADGAWPKAAAAKTAAAEAADGPRLEAAAEGKATARAVAPAQSPGGSGGSGIDMQACVRAFYARFGVAAPEVPSLPGQATAAMRLRLIREEADELAAGLAAGDLVDVADAIADLLYVTVGTAVACGIDVVPIFAEVHRSNMTKDTGAGLGPDGKIVKGAGFEPPVLAPLLQAQGWRSGGGGAAADSDRRVDRQ